MDRHKDFWQITEDSLDKSMRVFEIDPDMKEELLNLYKVLSPYSEVEKILKLLKVNNRKLAILSNGTPNLLNQLVHINNLDNLFDNIFSIEEVGIYKPSSKVYDIPVKNYKIKKNEIAFLSANTWDVSGAGNYGYQSIWVNRNRDVFDYLDFKPKNQINSLKGLLDIIK